MPSKQNYASVTKDPDSQAEFRKRHGIINQDIPVGNAEALIRAHNAAQSRAVKAASLNHINDKATAELDYEELAGQLGDDEILSAAVRGNAIVVVALDPNGRSYKAVLPANDQYKPPVGDEDEDAAAAGVDAELRFLDQVAQLRSEYESQLEAAKEDMRAEVTAQIQALQSGAQSEPTTEEPEAEAEELTEEQKAAAAEAKATDEEQLKAKSTTPAVPPASEPASEPKPKTDKAAPKR